MYMEVQWGDSVGDTLQVVPSQRVQSADHHQGARLGACHQPIMGLIRDLDGHKTQDGTGVNLLLEGDTEKEMWGVLSDIKTLHLSDAICDT